MVSPAFPFMYWSFFYNISCGKIPVGRYYYLLCSDYTKGGLHFTLQFANSAIPLTAPLCNCLWCTTAAGTASGTKISICNYFLISITYITFFNDTSKSNSMASQFLSHATPLWVINLLVRFFLMKQDKYLKTRSSGMLCPCDNLSCRKSPTLQ